MVLEKKEHSLYSIEAESALSPDHPFSQYVASILGNVVISDTEPSIHINLDEQDNDLDKLRYQAGQTIVHLASQIQNEIDSGDSVALVGMMRGGLTTSIAVQQALELMSGTKYPLVGLPFYRDLTINQKVCISPRSVERFLRQFPSCTKCFLIDGWIGTGESVITGKEKLLRFDSLLGRPDTALSVMTAVGVDFAGVADLYGTTEDQPFLHGLSYHNSIGMEIVTPSSDDELPTVYISQPAAFLVKELDILLDMLDPIIANQRRYPQTDYPQAVSNYLSPDSSMRFGVGVNEAQHRCLRDDYTLLIPEGKSQATLDKLSRIIGIPSIRISKEQPLNKVIAVPLERYWQHLLETSGSDVNSDIVNSLRQDTVLILRHLASDSKIDPQQEGSILKQSIQIINRFVAFFGDVEVGSKQAIIDADHTLWEGDVFHDACENGIITDYEKYHQDLHDMKLDRINIDEFRRRRNLNITSTARNERGLYSQGRLLGRKYVQEGIVYPQAIDRLGELSKKGVQVNIVSQSPRLLVQGVCDTIADYDGLFRNVKVIGTEILFLDDSYKILFSCNDTGKFGLVQQLLAQNAKVVFGAGDKPESVDRFLKLITETGGVAIVVQNESSWDLLDNRLTCF